jgi:UDP-N-acetylmuramoyl-tripeptide--D-alanyl-D-alanine ligase
MTPSVRAFAELCGGRYSGEDRACAGVSTDTRTLRPGEIYLALRGPRFDGNEFLGAAAAAGAVAAVIDRPVTNAPLPVIHVDDGQSALTRAAGSWRAKFRHRGRRRGSNGRRRKGDDVGHPLRADRAWLRAAT